MNVKVISAASVNLQKSIEDWMALTKIQRIGHITQSESQGIITLVIFYEPDYTHRIPE